MFTLSVAFLFFSASSFELINTLVLKGFDKAIGADIYVFAAVTQLLAEGPLTTYLNDQMSDESGKLVEDFAFSSLDLRSALALGGKDGQRTYLMGAS